MSDSPYEQELDAHDARVDFENVLQGILAKANAGGESLTSNQLETEEENSNEEVNKWQRSSASSPHKPATPKIPRKKRKREEIKEEKPKSNSFIMKLFDRSVDLASFNDVTPLYPICRAWMENDPTGKLKPPSIQIKTEEPDGSGDDGFTSNAESEEEKPPGTITKIPPPNVPWNNIDENGVFQSPRIPVLLPQPDDKLDLYLLNQAANPPSAETLLVNHLRHWRNVRETWKAKSLENESRYEDGMRLLRHIFQQNAYNSSTG